MVVVVAGPSQWCSSGGGAERPRWPGVVGRGLRLCEASRKRGDGEEMLVAVEEEEAEEVPDREAVGPGGACILFVLPGEAMLFSKLYFFLFVDELNWI